MNYSESEFKMCEMCERWWNEITRVVGHCSIIRHQFPGDHYYNGGRLGSYHAPESNERVVVLADDGSVVGMSDRWDGTVTPALISAGEKVFELFANTEWAGKMWFTDNEKAYALTTDGYTRNETQLVVSE